MRYTQTKLDKIIMIGLGKMDNAIEAVIESYHQEPNPEDEIRQDAAARGISGLHNMAAAQGYLPTESFGSLMQSIARARSGGMNGCDLARRHS